MTDLEKQIIKRLADYPALHVNQYEKRVEITLDGIFDWWYSGNVAKAVQDLITVYSITKSFRSGHTVMWGDIL